LRSQLHSAEAEDVAVEEAVAAAARAAALPVRGRALLAQAPLQVRLLAVNKPQLAAVAVKAAAPAVAQRPHRAHNLQRLVC
jgi:microcystin-dependent protein